MSSLNHYEQICSYCRLCEIVCSFQRLGEFSPRRASIKVTRPNRHDAFLLYCRQCEEPECLSACPVGAISKEKDGTVLVDQQLCTACEACITACSYGAMFFDVKDEMAYKCDLCKGDPLCVKSCPKGALSMS